MFDARRCLARVVTGAALFSPVLAAALPTYGLTVIGNGHAAGINDTGVVIGLQAQGGGAFQWSSAGGLQSMPTFAARPGAINASGAIVGVNGSGTAALLHDPAGNPVVSTLVGGQSFVRADAINDAGVAAISFQSGNTQGLYRYTPGAGLSTVMTSTQGAYGRDINNAGVIVGSDGNSAVIWDAGNAMTVIGGVPVGSSAEAIAINNGNLVVGEIQDNVGNRDGFVVVNGMALALGTSTWRAVDVNDAGVIVGSLDAGGGFVAEWNGSSANPTALSSLLDSSAAGWTIIGAIGINNAGQIVAQACGGPGGLPCNGESTTMVLLTPVGSGGGGGQGSVPLPGSLALMAFGALASVSRRRLRLSA